MSSRIRSAAAVVGAACIALSAILALLSVPATPQSTCPNIAYGAVLTPAQWQVCFQNKQDFLGFTPLNPSNLVGQAPIVVLTAGGITTVSITPSASSQTNVASPSGTASTAGVMMGIAGSITPTVSGRIQFLITGDVTNNTSGDGAAIQCRYGTGGAPSNGAALAGNTVNPNSVKFVSASSANKSPFSCSGIVSGLIVGTPYWIDFSLAAITGGTATAADISASAEEF